MNQRYCYFSCSWGHYYPDICSQQDIHLKKVSLRHGVGTDLPKALKFCQVTIGPSDAEVLSLPVSVRQK